MEASKVVDATAACCQDTLATPIKNAVAAMAAGEVLEVIITPNFKSLFSGLAEQQGYAILEEMEQEDGIHVTVRISEEPQQERKEDKPITAKMLKVPPVANYPTEAGCFLRGNHYSPVAVVVLLNAPYGTMPPKVESIPPEIEKLVKVAVETGAALSGTLQTENIGIEKVVCNIVGNPNIRYLVLCGTEVAGHQSGSALRALLVNGINNKRTIIGSQGVTPYLFNIPLEAIERFQKQVSLVDLVGEMDPEIISKAVWCCYQENPTEFKDYMLHDPGAYSEAGIPTTLTGKVEHPEEIEEWELDDVLRKIEAGEAEPSVQPVTIKQEKKEQVKELGEVRIRSFLSKQLQRISEELRDLAELLGEETEVPSAPPLPVEEREVAAESEPSTVVKEKPVEKPVALEEAPTLVYFKSQLRGFHNVLAGLEACDRDICHGGRSLPLAVVSTIKKLERLKAGLEEATLPAEDKANLMTRLQGYLERAEALPQEPGPCQKTVGTCTVGVGCFASASADLVKLVKTPEPPAGIPGG